MDCNNVSNQYLNLYLLIQERGDQMLLAQLEAILNGTTRRLKLEVDRDIATGRADSEVRIQQLEAAHNLQIQKINDLAAELGYDLTQTKARVSALES